MSKKDVIKHTSAIHTSGTLSLLERKLSNVLLYNAYDNLLIDKQHQINISLLCEVSGYNSGDRKEIKEALQRLTSITITWDILNSEGISQEWGASSLLSSVKFKDGICTYEYSTALAEKLSEPEVYGRINLQVQRNFKSGYALVVYEICSSYKGILNSKKTAYTKWMDLEVFKKLVGVDNSEYYNDFKRLNSKIIKSAVSEINGSKKKYASTDILISPEYKRTGRKVTDIRFKITQNPQLSLPIEQDEFEEIRKTDNYTRLIEYGFNDKGAIHVIQTNEESYVKEKLDLVDSAEKRGEIKSSVSGFLKKAIDDDYQPKSNKNKAKEEERRKKQTQELRENEEKEKNEALRKKISKELREKYLSSLSDEEKQSLLEELTKDKPKIIAKNIKDLSSPLLALEINDRIENFSEILEEKVKSIL